MKGTHKSQWSDEEDELLVQLVKKHGQKQWSTIANHFTNRRAKQCRERYLNHLDPSIKTEWWSPDEDKFIIEYHERNGNKWSDMAAKLPGRPANSIKNHWNSTLKRTVEKVKKHIQESGYYEIKLSPCPRRGDHSRSKKKRSEGVIVQVWLNAKMKDSKSYDQSGRSYSPQDEDYDEDTDFSYNGEDTPSTPDEDAKEELIQHSIIHGGNLKNSSEMEDDTDQESVMSPPQRAYPLKRKRFDEDISSDSQWTLDSCNTPNKHSTPFDSSVFESVKVPQAKRARLLHQSIELEDSSAKDRVSDDENITSPQNSISTRATNQRCLQLGQLHLNIHNQSTSQNAASQSHSISQYAHPGVQQTAQFMQSSYFNSHIQVGNDDAFNIQSNIRFSTMNGNPLPCAQGNDLTSSIYCKEFHRYEIAATPKRASSMNRSVSLPSPTNPNQDSPNTNLSSNVVSSHNASSSISSAAIHSDIPDCANSNASKATPSNSLNNVSQSGIASNEGSSSHSNSQTSNSRFNSSRINESLLQKQREKYLRIICSEESFTEWMKATVELNRIQQSFGDQKEDIPSDFPYLSVF